MLTKRIIPCLDISHGQVVKSVQFENTKAIGDPLQLGYKYAESGADEVVFYDITASSEKRKTAADLASKIAKGLFIPFTIGGGIRNIEDMRQILAAGADKISINTPAIENPQLINDAASKFGSQCIVVSIDTHFENGEDYIYSHTGKSSTRKNTGFKTMDWVKEIEDRGAGEIVVNSMNADGTKKGFDLRILKKISSAVKIPVVASGGAGSPHDFFLAASQGKADAILAASIFHYGQYQVLEVKKYLQEKGIAVRL